MIAMDFPNAVTTASNFYNRSSEVEKAGRVLLASKCVPVIIIGERRIGKTSLQNVVMEAITAADPGCHMLAIDPRVCTSVDHFVTSILRRLTTLLKRDLRETGLLDASGHFHMESPDQFDQAIFSLLTPQPAEAITLCVDEFDEIVRLAGKAGEAEKDRLFGLVHHLIERSPLPMRLFFTMTRIPDPHKADYLSSLIAKSETIELLPLDKVTTQGMIDWLLAGQRPGPDVEARDILTNLSGGHPYFIKLLLSNLPEQQAIGPADVWNKVMPAALEDARARYAIENIYKAHFSPAEKSVLLYMAERGEPVDGEEFRASGREITHAARSLVNRHYLVEQAGSYTTQIRFLDYWFRNWLEFEEELERLNVHHMAGFER